MLGGVGQPASKACWLANLPLRAEGQAAHAKRRQEEEEEEEEEAN